MKKYVLTALTALGVAGAGFGVAYAQNMGQQNGYPTKSADVPALTTTSTSSSPFRGPTLGFVPNPFDGTQTWDVWNKDHPPMSGDN